MQCSVDITVVAAGAPPAQATWSAVVLRFAYGFDRSTFADSVVLPASQLQEAFGAPAIRPGESQQAEFRVWAGIPFSAEIDLRYRVGSSGPNRSATAGFDCGPRPVAGGAAPTLANVTLPPADRVLQVGSSLFELAYSASGETGLFATAVEFEGAFSQMLWRTGSFRQSVRESFALMAPDMTRFGDRMRIRVHAIDIAGRVTSTEFVDGPTVVDTIPPRVLFITNPSGAHVQFGATDTLTLSVTGSDNHRLHSLVYRIDPIGVQDSVTLDTRNVHRSVEVPLRPEWIGPLTITARVRDAGGLVHEHISPADSVHVYPIRSRPVRNVAFEGEPRDVAYDPRSDRLFVVIPSLSRIEAVSLASMTSRTLATFASRTWSVDVSPDGSTLIATLPDQGLLAVIDLRNAAAAPRTVRLAWGYPETVRFAANGRALVSTTSASTPIVEFDPATGVQTPREIGWPIQFGEQTAARSGDASRLFFVFGEGCNTVVYDAASDSFGPCRTPPKTGLPAASTDGHRTAWGSHALGRELQSLRFFPDWFLGTGISHDGTELWGATVRGLIRAPIDGAAYRERIPIPIPAVSASEVRVVSTRDGKRAVLVVREPSGPLWRTRVFGVELD